MPGRGRLERRDRVRRSDRACTRVQRDPAGRPSPEPAVPSMGSGSRARRTTPVDPRGRRHRARPTAVAFPIARPTARRRSRARTPAEGAARDIKPWPGNAVSARLGLNARCPKETARGPQPLRRCPTPGKRASTGGSRHPAACGREAGGPGSRGVQHQHRPVRQLVGNVIEHPVPVACNIGLVPLPVIDLSLIGHLAHCRSRPLRRCS